MTNMLYANCPHGDVFGHCRQCKTQLPTVIDSVPEMMREVLALQAKAQAYTRRTKVYQAIDTERTYQDIVWRSTTGKIDPSTGEPETRPHSHELEAYVLYMKNYLDECITILTRGNSQEHAIAARDALRKVLALGVAAAEEHGIRPREVVIVNPSSQPEEPPQATAEAGQ